MGPAETAVRRRSPWPALMLKTRLVLTLGVLVALAVVVGIVGITGLQGMGQQSARLYADGVLPMAQLSNLHDAELKVRMELFAYATAVGSKVPDPKVIGLWKDGVKQADGEEADGRKGYGTYATGKRAAAFAMYVKAWDTFTNDRDTKLFPLLDSGDTTGFWKEFLAVSKPAISDAADALDALQVVETDAGKSENAASKDTQSQRTLWSIVLLALAILVGTCLGVLLFRSILTPVRRMSVVLDGLAQGDLTGEIDLSRQDEFGAMSRSLKGATAHLCEVMASITTTAESLSTAADGLSDNSSAIAGAALETSRKSESVSAAAGEVDRSRQDEFGAMSRSLRGATAHLCEVMASITTTAESLSTAAEGLSDNSSAIAEAALETSRKSESVSAAAGEVSENVQAVATATAEMDASVREIAYRAQEAAKIGDQATRVISTANATVGKLGTSSVEIGNVLKLITSVAEQTNLLALNATIEAARAGDAGKGFAVVADEVKQLAQETGRATGDISQRVEAIQADTREAVAAIGEIGEIIRQLGDHQNTIASAVEEQTSTTTEIAHSISSAADGSTTIAADIVTVARAAETTTTGVAATGQAAIKLAELSRELERTVSHFRY